MNKCVIITVKVLATIALILLGLITLTNIKLNGFNIGDWKVTAEEVNMFVDTVGDYLFWLYVVFIIFIIWKKWIRKK